MINKIKYEMDHLNLRKKNIGKIKHVYESGQQNILVYTFHRLCTFLFPDNKI